MLINNRMTLDEAVHEWRKEEEARNAEKAEKEAYEMEVAAIGWAEEAAELWIPTKYAPVANGMYLTKDEYRNIHIALFYKGKWNGNVTGWLPLPEA